MEQGQHNPASSPSETEDVSSSVKLMQNVTTVCQWEFRLDEDRASDPPHEKIRSPMFWHSNSMNFFMEFMTSNKEMWLLFHLLPMQRLAPVKAKVKLSLKLNKTTPSFLTRTVSLKRPEEFNFSYTLDWTSGTHKFMICAEVTTPSQNSEADRRAACATEHHSGADDPEALYGHLLSIAGDLGALLDSGEMSDMVLCAEGTEMKAHRLLLAARSPVFAAMLRHDTREAQTGRVEVDDVEADTLRELLRYVYTGSAPGVRQVARQLLAAADKYGLKELKELCEDELIGTLSVDNAAAAGVTALRHSCELLKPAVINFIKTNLITVLASNGWSDAIRQHPDVVIEMNRLLAAKSME